MKSKGQNLLKMIILSQLLLCVAVLGICMVIALIVGKEAVPVNAAEIMACVLSLLTVYLTCLITAKKAGKNKMQVAVVLSVVYTGICLVTGQFLFEENALHFNWKCLLPIVTGLLAGLTSGMRKQRYR